jgi:ATP-binding cassette, subfamily B, bacterial PglK
MNKMLDFWKHLLKKRKRQFWLLNVLIIFTSFFEVISIGAVLPFIGIITTPEKIYENPFMQPIISALDLNSPDQLILPITIGFILAALLAGFMRLLLFYALTRYSYAVGADISIKVYKHTLYQKYIVHIVRNTSEVINGVVLKSGVAVGVIEGVLTIISSIVLVISIVIALFVVDASVALTAFLGFGILYFLIVRIVRQKLKKNSEIIAAQSTQRIKSLQEGLGGIRDILLNNSQHFYCHLFQSADLPLRKALGDNQFIRFSPRYIMEMFGMIAIAGLAYALSLNDEGQFSTLPVLGAFALGAQRLLPALQQVYSSYSRIKGSQASFYDVIDLLDQPLPDYAAQSVFPTMPFKKNIVLNSVRFRYSDETPWVINEINLEIIKGERIGFVGVTGSGKSTLLDIIMGLLSPTEGGVLIDGKTLSSSNRQFWQAHIAHVPQNIYLSDSTIEENIAFGIPKEKIDSDWVKKVAQQAQIAKVIEGWEGQYQTIVGERGMRLSGGQRQRIGIARALYRKASVLIFDEATSALDIKTEKSVMEAIDSLGKDLTILIIAHRLSTLKGCDRIIELNSN